MIRMSCFALFAVYRCAVFVDPPIYIEALWDRMNLTCKEPHAVLNRRKKRLLEKLEEVQSLLDDVRANCLEGEQRIFALAEQATNELQVLTEEKMSILLSDQLEAARQLSQIEWSKQFVKYSQSILPPADFLMAWLRHCRVREEFELLSLNTCKLGEGVVADMRLEGRVDILTDTVLRHEVEHQRVLDDTDDS
eukprot:GHVN01018501.1.p1 GENE.GHVN01018501.1~~GHVN01018501.1.p1  ORF type:complete len:193 (-),score=27.54 GHVN01018501.1:352-930(-)